MNTICVRLCVIMDVPIRLYSQEMSPSGTLNPFTVSVEESLWRLHFDNENAGRFFLRIQSEDGTTEWIAPAGDILYKKMITDEENIDEHYHIYMPVWMLDAAGFEGAGETLKCSLLSNDAFPQATKIVLRVIDSAFYNSDIKAELESALTQLGVLRKHTTIQIPVGCLGNYPIELFVSELEPADCVLCEGDEVAVEFEEPVDQVQPPNRPPTPVPQSPPVLPQIITDTEPNQYGFTAFQGQGYSLQGSNPNLPEWRKNLPPPRRRQP